MKWCNTCMYSISDVSITDEEWQDIYKQFMNSALREAEEQLKPLKTVLDSKTYQKLLEETAKKLMPFSSKEEYVSYIKAQMNELKRHYKLVVYCRRKHTIVVANPDNQTMITDMSSTCEYYREKGGG